MSSNTVEPAKGQSPKSSARYFPALTGLRAIAAWLVFVHHFSPFAEGSLGRRITGELHIGVAIFFVLSGLLICGRYINSLELSVPWFIRYMRNRVARIYPLYFLVTCATFAVVQFNPAYDVMTLWSHYHIAGAKLIVIILNLTFLRGLFESFRLTGVAPGWTLTVEEIFYFLAPFMLVGLRNKPSKLFLYAAGLLGTGVCLVLFAPHPYGFFGSFEFLFDATFFGRCIEFLAGMGLALFLLKRAEATSNGFYTWGGLTWIVGVLGLLVWTQNTPSHIILNNVVLVPGICALLLGLIREQTSLQRLLATKAFQLFGKASYAFYLIHLGILSRLLDFHVSTNLLVKFLITNAIAVLLFSFIEEPLHRRIAKR
jgi:peptidoglycan/LPS O-acetylase OafA/YrhL